jgi:segregation and condensation protein B
MNVVDSVEALLFVAEAPVPIEQIAQALVLTEGQVAQALEVLEARLDEKGPLCVVRLAGGYQLSTKPEYAEEVSRFLKPQAGRLGKSLMEVLAIVAYRQPITLAELEQIRGVQSDYSVRSLVERRLVVEVGRKQTPGRPVLYGTTDEFLHQFKLNSLTELPPLDENSERHATTLFDFPNG